MIAAAAAAPGCVGQHAKVSVWCYGLRLDTFNLPEVPHLYVTNSPTIYRIKDRDYQPIVAHTIFRTTLPALNSEIHTARPQSSCCGS